MRNITVLTLVLVVLSSALLGDDFKSPQAVQAKKSYDQQLVWAEAQYKQAVQAAKKEYSAKLKAALDTALKAKNLDEANLINAEMEAMKDDAAPAKAKKSNLAVFEGEWTVNYANNYVRQYQISKSGKIAFVSQITSSGARETPNKQSTLMTRGEEIIVSWSDDDIIERLTVSGDRIFVEHFKPASSLRAGTPLLGIATRK